MGDIEMSNIEPWVSPDSPNIVTHKYTINYPDFSSIPIEVMVSIRFPTPLLESIFCRDEQIMEMIKNNLSYKDFVIEANKDKKVNPIPYSIQIIKDVNNPSKIKALVKCNPFKYLEMVKYGVDRESVYKDYIEYAKKDKK
jgi:phage-related protein